MKKLLFGNWVARLAWLMMLTWPMVGLLCDDGRRTWENARPIPTVSQMELDSMGGLVKVGEWRVSVLDQGISPCILSDNGVLIVNEDKICLRRYTDASIPFETIFLKYGGGGCYFNKDSVQYFSKTLVCIDYASKRYLEIKLKNPFRFHSIFDKSGAHKLKNGYLFRNSSEKYYLRVDTNGVMDTIPFVHNGEVDRSFSDNNLFIKNKTSYGGKYSLCQNDSCHVLGFIDNYTDEIPSVEVYGGQIYIYNSTKFIKWGSK